MFSKCRQKIKPRPSQQAVLDLVFGEKKDEKKWYIVSPPGSGKTILALMTAIRLNVPTLVLVPNTAIQSQWVDKTRYFIPDDQPDMTIASVNPEDNTPITVLTYQALAKTREITEEEKEEIIADWITELVEETSDTDQEAIEWLVRYEEQNPDRYYASLMRRWKKKRISIKEDDSLLSVVDDNALELMKSFRDKGVKLVIFDECHHLVGYWAQVALALVSVLDGPRIMGLTATPPGKSDINDQETELHLKLLDKIDFILPTPAVVRDGHLAPYQDLVYFTRPTAEELEYISHCSTAFSSALRMAESHDGTTLSEWLAGELNDIPTENFASTLRRRAGFITAAVRYLRLKGIQTQPRYHVVRDDNLTLEEIADLSGRYAARCLLVSENASDREFYRQLNHAFRPLGYQLTERGLRMCQSTVSRILALSEAKIRGAVELLSHELKSGIDIRALVITDFEKSSATIAKDIETLLTEESGGAIAAMRALTSNETTDGLDPVLVTGQTVLVDDDLLPAFKEKTREWIDARKLRIEMQHVPDGGFFRVNGSGPDWTTRNYVAMITDIFEKGVTRCLVGTRGLLGEGWDSLRVNTLVDLTTAATEMTVNQLRGRSIRLDPSNPRKVANNWDVVCFAPEFECGLSDYKRFARKHSRYYGICDDTAIEYGLGHIHPSLTDSGPEDVALNAHVINEEMFSRCTRRDKIYKDWKIGEPYKNKKIPSLELKVSDPPGRGLIGTIGHMKGFTITAGSMLRKMSTAIIYSLMDIGKIAREDVKVSLTERSDNYFRLFLETGKPEERELFSQCVNELFMPIEDQRYIIPRYCQELKDRWFSQFMPEIIRIYMCKKINRIAVYHPLPEIFGSSKKNAEIFTKHWNQHVSPGEAIYTKRGKGEEILQKAIFLSRSSDTAAIRERSVWK